MSSTTRPRSTSRRTAAPASAAPTTTPAWTSGAPGPRRRSPRPRDAFLAHVRAGRVSAHGEQGSAAKWAHAAMALAIRALGRGEAHRRPRPRRRAADGRAGDDRGRRPHRRRSAATSAPRTRAPCCAPGWMRSTSDERAPSCSRCCSPTASRTPTSSAAPAAARAPPAAAVATAVARPGAARRGRRGVFTACVAAIPYAPAAAFLGAREGKLATREGEPVRVALVADGIGGMHGVTHTIDEIRERGVPGFEVEVIGTDPHVDRRLSAVAEVEIPFYEGLTIGVPTLPAVVEALAEGRYDVVHLCSPGPAGRRRGDDRPRAGAADRRLLPHRAGRLRRRCGPATTALAAGRRGRAGRVLRRLRRGALALARRPTRACARSASRRRGSAAGTAASTSPASRPRCAPARPTVASASCTPAGSTKEKGVDLLADAFLAARARDPRLELVLAGGGPEEDALRARLGGAATFLGWLEGDALARAYADADLFLLLLADRHVRAGRARGAGLRAAGRRGRRGRPGGADRRRALGRPVPAARRARWRTPLAGLAAHPASRRRLARAGSPPSASAPGSASLAAPRRRLAPRARQPARARAAGVRRGMSRGVGARAPLARSPSRCTTSSRRPSSAAR